jgi:hypothetical protein
MGSLHVVERDDLLHRHIAIAALSEDCETFEACRLPKNMVFCEISRLLFQLLRRCSLSSLRPGGEARRFHFVYQDQLVAQASADACPQPVPRKLCVLVLGVRLHRHFCT